MEMKTLNGYEVVDAKARQDIETLKQAGVDIDLSEYAKKTDIPVVPTNVSAFKNDKLYVNRDYVDNKVNDIADSFFLSFSDAPTGEENAKAAYGEMITFANMIVNGKDACVQIRDSHDDMYYPALIQYDANNGNWLINLMKVSGCLNSIDNGWSWDIVRLQYNSATGWKYYKLGTQTYSIASKAYVDEAVLNASTGEISLSNYYTKAEVDAAIDAIEIPEAGDVDLSDYYTKSEVDALIPTDYLTESDLDSYAYKSYVDNAIFNEANSCNELNNSTIMKKYTRTDSRTNYYEGSITEIYQLNDTTYYGHSTQFKTGASCTVRDDSACTWVGDDCTDGVFTPQANTYYEVYSYLNSNLNKTINMVMNLGA